jgi:hypothetical protein
LNVATKVSICNYTIAEQVVELLICWHNGLGKFSSDMWNLVPLYLMCTLWRERNRRTFEDIAKSERQLLNCFISLLFDWSIALGFSSSLTALDFVVSLSLHPISSLHVTILCSMCSCFMHT